MLKNETGSRHGQLTVLSFAGSQDGALWLCLCDCGKETIVKGTLLRYGTVKSCGCGSIKQAKVNCGIAREAQKIPYPHSEKLQDVLQNMKKRCYSPSNHRWGNYGGRGIKICDEWLNDGMKFYKWATENGYAPGLQIDRIDVDGNYEPRNCRFVDVFVQQNNTTRNRFLEWNGQTKTVADWARELGVRCQALQHRVGRGWSTERIFTQKFRSPRFAK